MQNKNSLYLVLVVVLTALSIWIYSINPYSYGLDVKGGSRFVLQMDMSSLSAEQQARPSEVQARVRRILEERVASALAVVEGSVTTRGTDQFIVELPDIQDTDQARSLLSTTAKIQVYHARNVSTSRRARTYDEAGDARTETGSPYVQFVRRADPSKVLNPEDPEYQQMLQGWDVIIEGEEIKSARVTMQNSRYQPNFEWGEGGTQKMGDWSRRYNRDGEKIAFVLDGRVLNIAPIQEGAILRGGAFIDGDFDPAYVTALVDLINSGSLPVELKELASQTVDPTIGQAALEEMVIAGAVSLAIICVILIAYYSFPGVLATVAMILYTLFTLTVLKAIGATFSLAAIAGFILSAGMAVDANVLVFERIKEELKAGRKLSTAIELGFKRAFAAIVDTNMTTILTSMVLWFFGTGPVKGFATTLIIGVVISFFTTITVTRSLLVGVTALGKFTNPKWYAIDRQMFRQRLSEDGNNKMTVISKSNRYFVLSIVLVAIGWIFVAIGGIKPNVEFQGGFEAQYRLEDPNMTGITIRQNLEQAGYEGANVKLATADGARWAYITLPQQEGLDFGAANTVNQIGEAAQLPLEGASLNEVGPVVAQETVTDAGKAVLIASAIIVFYMAIRFGATLGGFKNGMKFGMAALVALIHDVLFVMGIAGVVGIVLGWEISALFVTAMLTVIGFSVHDSIVIFDRLRENLAKSSQGKTLEEVMDMSIRQSITRSIMTSLLSIVPMVAMLIWGAPTPELKFMMLTMLAGVVAGTYSSIFNATPVLYLWNNMVMKKKGEQFGLLQEAQREAKVRASATLATATAAGPAAEAPGDSAYGTIKRKRSVREQASSELDDDV